MLGPCENVRGCYVLLVYRAGRLLYPCLDPEGCRTDVFKAKELRFGHSPELTHTSDFGWFHQHDLRTPHHLSVMDLHVPIEKLLLTKVLQSLWFNEGGSAARGAITDGATFEIVARLSGAQTQLLSGGESREEIDKRK